MEKLIVNKPQRKKKDPNAPKGPGNVFFLYCRLERDKIKDEHPTENLGEVTRLLGQKWKSLSKEEKTVCLFSPLKKISYSNLYVEIL
jgi:non-histone protein 10